MGSRKSIPARSAISASFLLSGQLPDQRSGTSVTARPEEQLAPNKPICSLLPPCIARRAFNDGGGACTAHLSQNLPPVIAEKFSSRIPTSPGADSNGPSAPVRSPPILPKPMPVFLPI